MRATDDRYRGEQAKFDLAMRMIEHEARTGTIRYFTGMNDDRIRKLYTTYFKHSGSAGAPATRPLADPHRAARADAAARAGVGRVRATCCSRNGLISVEQPPGPPLKVQHRSRPSVLRVLRVVRSARAAQRAVVRVGLESIGEHAPRRRARDRALRPMLDLLRVRRPVAAALGLPGLPVVRAVRIHRAARRGRVALRDVPHRRRPRCRVGLSVDRRRQPRRAARAADAQRRMVGDRACVRRARSRGGRNVARGRWPRAVRGRDEHSRPGAATGTAVARRIGRGLSHGQRIRRALCGACGARRSGLRRVQLAAVRR